MGSVPPVLIFLVGALVVALTKGHVRRVVLLAIPVIGALNLLGLEDGATIELELLSYTLVLFEVDDLDRAIQDLSSEVGLAFVTLGGRGSLVVQGSDRIPVEADELHAVVDTTGAGDLYAAGVLYGLSQGAALDHAARLGSIAAAEVISHLGARPEMDLVTVARSILG